MLFCPNCANILVISSETGYNKWACNTCAYEFPITKQVCRQNTLSFVSTITPCADDIQDKTSSEGNRRRLGRRRDVETCWFNHGWVFVLGLTDVRLISWFTASCDKCNHNQAYFYQLQIRSADEPMTTCMFSSSYFLICWPCWPFTWQFTGTTYH